ncbi:unnamed protein product, partial [Sphacelaria rigidula]
GRRGSGRSSSRRRITGSGADNVDAVYRLSPSGQIANMEQGDARRGDSNNGDRGNVNITPTTNNTNNISPQPAADAMVTTAIASTVATTQP